MLNINIMLLFGKFVFSPSRIYCNKTTTSLIFACSFVFRYISLKHTCIQVFGGFLFSPHKFELQTMRTFRRESLEFLYKRRYVVKSCRLSGRGCRDALPEGGTRFAESWKLPRLTLYLPWKYLTIQFLHPTLQIDARVRVFLCKKSEHGLQRSASASSWALNSWN